MFLTEIGYLNKQYTWLSYQSFKTRKPRVSVIYTLILYQWTGIHLSLFLVCTYYYLVYKLLTFMKTAHHVSEEQSPSHQQESTTADPPSQPTNKAKAASYHNYPPHLEPPSNERSPPEFYRLEFLWDTSTHDSHADTGADCGEKERLGHAEAWVWWTEARYSWDKWRRGRPHLRWLLEYPVLLITLLTGRLVTPSWCIFGNKAYTSGHAWLFGSRWSIPSFLEC